MRKLECKERTVITIMKVNNVYVGGISRTRVCIYLSGEAGLRGDSPVERSVD